MDGTRHQSHVRLTVNGARHQLDVAGNETLLRVLRDRLNLTGTKESCGRGECGACTVLVAQPGSQQRGVYACLTLAASLDDAQVTTIEGLSRSGDELHPLQEAFIARDAVQCGFCTPGQILAAAALLRENSSPTEGEIRDALSGNLCRCGTYPNIILAVQDAARKMAHDA